MSRSLTCRLAVAFAALGVAAAAVTAVAVNVAFDRRFGTYLGQRRSEVERRLVVGLAETYRRRGEWVPDELRAVGASAVMEGVELRVQDSSGATVWSSDGQLSEPMAEMHRQMLDSGPLGPPQRLSITVGADVVGTAEVRVPEGGLAPQDLGLRSSVNRSLVATGAVVGLAALGLGVALARRMAAPITELTVAAGELAAGDRSRRVGASRPDELGDMSRAFNRMADTIEDEDRLRRSFAADVAHELRTPLAVLRSQLEALQDGVVAPEPVALASLHDEVLRLSRLVDDLQALASADAAGFGLDRRSVALGPLLKEVAAGFRGPLTDGGVGLELDLDSDVALDADPLRLRQVVTNLLSNALKFTPRGGIVRLELGADKNVVTIRVADTGPGIPPEELGAVFDRFYRGQKVAVGGSGIGLAVVRQLVAAHGGTVEAASPPGQGITFSVKLPRHSGPVRFSIPDAPAPLPAQSS